MRPFSSAGTSASVTAAAALLLHFATAAHNVIDLAQQSWTLTSPQHDDIEVQGKVPSHAHVDLYDAQVIPDPLANLNEFELRWVAYSNWTYTSQIKGIHLVFDGLDTYAAIEFCGQHIANTDNQFRQYTFDISKALAECRARDPVLKVNFGPVPNISDAIAKLPGQETWPPTVCFQYEFPNRQFVRKQQSDFGWDWGPAFLPAGIWQPAKLVQLEHYGSVHVKNSAFDLYREGQLNNLAPNQDADWIFNASVDLVGTAPPGSVMYYNIYDSDSGDRVSSGRFASIKNHGDVITGVTKLDADDYELWWPVGFGAQKLYTMTVDVVLHRRKIATVNKRMGFRTVIINMEPISEEQLSQGITPGDNWSFQINGQEIFAKGSNFVPPDAFWPRVSRDDVKTIFTSVIDGNQNMLRVWSSGAYAPDFMYDLADEMGILLWCEFQFSVSLYPVAAEFLENARQEAVYQVRRANHHPSVAIWAGGNEMEKDQLPYIRDNYKSQYQRYLNEYFELFLNTLLPTVYGNSRSVGYMPCSTNNGYLKLDHTLPIPFVDRLYNLTPGYLYGDKDFYNYDAGQGFNINTYIDGRFANEFGFPSMPSLETWRQAIPDEQLNWTSPMVLLRNKHYPAGNLATNNFANPLRGMGEMAKGIKTWYPTPQKTNSVANFSAWCHTSQVYQADFYKNKIQYYRAASSLPQRQLGALYWQLNDIWQAPSWSSMEFDGRWKMMFYATKDIFEPVIVAPIYNVTNGILTIYAVSDQFSPVHGHATWQWVGYDGSTVESAPSASDQPFTVGAVNATVLSRVNMTQLKSQPDFPADNAVLVATVKATGVPHGSSATKTYEHSNFYTATPLSKAKIIDPGLTLRRDGSNFVVKAEKGLSAFTWLVPAAEDAGIVVVFDDNGFLLPKGESRTLGYRVVRGASDGWEDRVTVSSIWNNTLST